MLLRGENDSKQSDEFQAISVCANKSLQNQTISCLQTVDHVINSSIGGTGYSSFLGGNLIKVGGNKLTSLTS